MLIKFIIPAGLIAASIIPLWANETNLSKKEEIVVTASRSPENLKDAPVKMTIISGSELAKSNAPSIDTYLKQIPEINFSYPLFAEKNARTITLRGFSDQGHTLVLIDGIPINSPHQDRVEWGLVTPENIERVEIAYGPMSSLYGSSAMGGVINILTKIPREKSQSMIKTTAGNLGAYSLSGAQSGRQDKFAYSVNVRSFHTNGYIAEEISQSYNIKRERNDWNATGKFIWLLDNQSSLTLTSSDNNEEWNYGRAYNYYDRQSNINSLSYQKEFNSLNLSGSVFSNQDDSTLYNDKAPAYNLVYNTSTTNSGQYGEVCQMSTPVADNHLLTGGVDYKHNFYVNTVRYQTIARQMEGKGQQNLTSLFIQDEIKLSNDKLITTAGLRWDSWESYDGSYYDTNTPAINITYNDRKDSALSPKLGALYHLDDKTDLRGSIGKGFKAPSVHQLYNVIITGSTMIYGNPELNPEICTSYELGARHQFSDSLNSEISLYQTYVDDLIGTYVISPTRKDYTNLSSVSISGLESSLKYKMNTKWSFMLGYVFSKSIITDNDTDPTLENKNIERSPRHKGQIGILYNNPDLDSGNLTARYQSRMYDDTNNTIELGGYWNVDMNLTRQINRNMELSLRVENVIDRKYDLPWGSTGVSLESPGRMITLGLKTEF